MTEKQKYYLMIFMKQIPRTENFFDPNVHNIPVSGLYLTIPRVTL